MKTSVAPARIHPTRRPIITSAWIAQLRWFAAGAVAAFLVPLFPRRRTPQQLAKDGCFACHSNQTRWPWYSSLAPISWLTVHDVNSGRSTFNFSRWDKGHPELSEFLDAISSGSMPPLQYRILHSEARLSKREKQQLMDGLRRTLGR